MVDNYGHRYTKGNTPWMYIYPESQQKNKQIVPIDQNKQIVSKSSIDQIKRLLEYHEIHTKTQEYDYDFARDEDAYVPNNYPVDKLRKDIEMMEKSKPFQALCARLKASKQAYKKGGSSS